MRYFIWMLFLLFISGCVYEKPKENVTTEDENAALVFKELDLSLKQEGGRLWNHSLQSPLMLVDRQSSHGTVYPNMRITYNWGILEVDSGGALLAPQWNKVTLEYPSFISDTLIRGNGWILKPGKGWKTTVDNGELVLVNSEE